jgi:hypothetical protein
MAVDPSSANAASAAANLGSSRLNVAGAIRQAASSTGTSFQYLLATAKMESDFNPAAGASTSTAHGLYQFIDQTWLATVKEAGSQLGYGQYADAITKSASGSYAVDDPATRSAIMKLRDDPVAASAMAGLLTQSNSFQLTGQIGRRPTDSELYMAHFMGVGAAAKLISAAEDNSQASAAAMFPNAAAANQAIFYDHSGSARSVSEVYSVLSARYAGAANSPSTRNAITALGDVTPGPLVASVTPAAPPMDNAAYLAAFPDTRSAAVASASSSDSDGVFRSLFLVGERTQPVSPAVQALWGNSSSLTSTSAAAVASAAVPSTPAPSASVPQPLDLFSDRNGTFSG